VLKVSVFKIVLEDFFNSWVDVIDLSLNSKNYIIIPKEKISCRSCKQILSVRQSKGYVTFLCGCGCRIFYPPDKDGIIVTKFVSKEEYNKGVYCGRTK
jgi:hypothetical protein